MKRAGFCAVLICCAGLALFAGGKTDKKAAGNTAREIALTGAPQTAADYLNRGLIFAIRGDFDIALRDFDEAVKLKPDMALAYLQRGKTYLARQVTEKSRIIKGTSIEATEALASNAAELAALEALDAMNKALKTSGYEAYEGMKVLLI